MITLAYAGRLDLLLRPGWPVCVVDMVHVEVTRNQTPTSEAIARFVEEQRLPVAPTDAYRLYQQRLADVRVHAGPLPRKAGLGELAIQEYMIRLGLEDPPKPAAFLFEDHKIVRASFHLPDNVRRISTRALLIFLQEKSWIASADDIERSAIQVAIMNTVLLPRPPLAEPPEPYDGMPVPEVDYWGFYYLGHEVTYEWNNGVLEEKGMLNDLMFRNSDS